MSVSAILLPACLAVSAFASFGWLTFVEGAGTLGEPTVLVFPPHWSKDQVFSATASLNTPIVELWPNSLVAVVVFNTSAAAGRAYDTGAWIMLNAKAAALCGVASTSQR